MLKSLIQSMCVSTLKLSTKLKDKNNKIPKHSKPQTELFFCTNKQKWTQTHTKRI